MNTTPTKQIFDFIPSGDKSVSKNSVDCQGPLDPGLSLKLLPFIQEVRKLSFCATEGAQRINALQTRIDAIASAIAATSHLQTVYQEKSKNIGDSLEQVAAVLRET